MDHENSIESVHRYYVSLMYIRMDDEFFLQKHSQNILKKKKSKYVVRTIYEKSKSKWLTYTTGNQSCRSKGKFL